MLLAEGCTVAGKYRIERVLGQGGMGTVYRARHLLLDRAVAIKILRTDTTEHPLASERLLREGRALARLRGRHIARVLDVEVEDSGACFLVLEYLDGEDLGSVLAHERPLPVARAITYVLQVCDALAEAHRLGIVHRDIKPSNLFLTTLEDGSSGIKLIDFGISKQAQPSTAITQSQSMLGSPCYMAPEQMRASGSVDARSDIWALGVVLYELLVGIPPHRGASVLEICAEILESSPKSPKAMRTEIPDALDAAIRKCMARDPTQRFSSVGELSSVLVRCSGTGTERLGWILPNDSSQQGATTPSLADMRESEVGRHTATAAIGPTPVHRPRFGIKSRLVGAFTVIGLLLAAIHPMLRRDQREVRPNPTLEPPLRLDRKSSGPSPSVVLPTADVPPGGSPMVQPHREPIPLASKPVPPVGKRRASPSPSGAQASASGARASANGAQASASSPAAKTGNETPPSAATVHSGVEPGSPLDPVLQYGRF